jgi:predicted NUDIX family NTP pyrophosphohydrolase
MTADGCAVVLACEAQRRHRGVSPHEPWCRGAAGPSRRTFLAQQGRRRLVNPKGEIGTTEDPETAARREFAEELGPFATIGPLRALGEVTQRGGKRVIAFAGEGDFDPAKHASNLFRD